LILNDLGDESLCLTCPAIYDTLIEVSEKKKPVIRKRVEWNTGERVHKPKKGKGSYDRKKGLDK